MTIQEIADRLVALSRREGKFETAQRELYTQDARSTEPDGAMMPNAQGLDAIIAKGDAFQEVSKVCTALRWKACSCQETTFRCAS